jgi:hypothetical protein
MSARFLLVRNETDRDWRQEVFTRVADHLRARGRTVDVVHRETFDLHQRGRLGRLRAVPLAVRDSVAFLQEVSSGEFWVLDCHDWPDPADLEPIVRDPRCQRVLKCQYDPDRLAAERYSSVTPWTYFEPTWPALQERVAPLRARARTEPIMYFRGHLWEEREPVVRLLQERGVLNPDASDVPYERYLDEMASHAVALSLSGMGDFCHRDVEALAVGTCLLRPRLPIRFHGALEPDVHYVSVDTDIESDPPQLAAQRIEERFRDLIRNRGYLDFVALKGSDWYDSNVRLPAVLDLTEELLDLPD